MVRQAVELHRYSTEMYGNQDIYVPAIDYEDKKFSWREISEQLLGDGNNGNNYKRFMDMIEAASFLKKDI